ncbi:MAG: adenylate kinase [Saprospiraceae bacterium]|nr:adenylate kinase [Saprospiraceae bacterium]
MLNLILFGPPGSGKGTQAIKIAEAYGLIHISTGDLFRYEMSHNTPLGLKAKEYISEGKLVPDEITIGMLANKLDQHLDAKGFILDGFPRTIPQAEALDTLFESHGWHINMLLALDVSEDEIVTRILKRGETSGRSDDTDESVIRNRIHEYEAKTAPLYAFYDDRNKAYTFNGIGSIEEIFQGLCALIDEHLS